MKTYTLYYNGMFNRFPTKKERGEFILKRVLTVNEPVVFVLRYIYGYTPSMTNIYIFDHFTAIREVVKADWLNLTLAEYPDYKTAYAAALEMRAAGYDQIP